MNDKENNYTKYISPYSWRYGSKEMREIWSEKNKRIIWRRIWVILAEAQSEYGLVTPEQVADLRNHAQEIDIARSVEIETEIQHDLMSELKTFAEQCTIGGSIIHLGMTSTDVVDNTDVLRVRQSLDLILAKLQNLLLIIAELVDTWADEPLMGFTHLQPAEPSTLGYRLAQYAQDFYIDWKSITRVRENIKGKGFRGAVGTSASYVELLGLERLATFEKRISDALGLKFFTITTQVYPRKQDYDVLSALAGFGASINKFAFDLRILQSPSFGELGEPFSEKQVGSSAMPFKRNPVKAESANSLARLLAQMPRVAWDNAALTLLERSLDDSANRRTSLPESFLIADELLRIATLICEGLRVDERALSNNLATFGSFAATERVLMALVKAGADRQEMHEKIRQLTLKAWDAIGQGQPNPLTQLIVTDPDFSKYLSTGEIKPLMNAVNYIGDSSIRARRLAKKIQKDIGS